jgi:hypothetical protein
VAHKGDIPGGSGERILSVAGRDPGGDLVVEVHGVVGGDPDVDARWWNPDGGGVILAARLGNPRRGWGI